MTDREQERAAVVAWLRSQAVTATRDAAKSTSAESVLAANTATLTMMNAAALIERGEHMASDHE